MAALLWNHVWCCSLHNQGLFTFFLFCYASFCSWPSHNSTWSPLELPVWLCYKYNGGAVMAGAWSLFWKDPKVTIDGLFTWTVLKRIQVHVGVGLFLISFLPGDCTQRQSQRRDSHRSLCSGEREKERARSNATRSDSYRKTIWIIPSHAFYNSWGSTIPIQRACYNATVNLNRQCMHIFRNQKKTAMYLSNEFIIQHLFMLTNTPFRNHWKTIHKHMALQQ